MGLESGDYIDDLVITNPTDSDGMTQGDDHIRLLKKVLKQSFPNFDGAATAADQDLQSRDDGEASLAAAMGTGWTLDAGSILLRGVDGTVCLHIKATSDGNGSALSIGTIPAGFRPLAGVTHILGKLVDTTSGIDICIAEFTITAAGQILMVGLVVGDGDADGTFGAGSYFAFNVSYPTR